VARVRPLARRPRQLALPRVPREPPGRYRIVDLNKFVSPQGRFTDELDGQVIRGDGVHFNTAGSNLVVSWLTPQLQEVAAGVDPDPVDDTARPDSRGLWAK
jgi:hypothetical protein